MTSVAESPVPSGPLHWASQARVKTIKLLINLLMDPLPGDAVAAQPQPPWCREIEIKLFQTCQSRSEVGRQFNQTPAPVDSLFPSPGRRCHLRDQGNTGVSDHFPIFYVWTIIRFCSQMWQKLGFFILATTTL